MKQVRIKYKGNFTVYKEGNYYVAMDPLLNLSTQATTKKQLNERIAEVLDIFFEDLVERDNLDVLLEHGFTKKENQFIPPVIVDRIEKQVSIPLCPA